MECINKNHHQSYHIKSHIMSGWTTQTTHILVGTSVIREIFRETVKATYTYRWSRWWRLIHMMMLLLLLLMMMMGMMMMMMMMMIKIYGFIIIIMNILLSSSSPLSWSDSPKSAVYPIFVSKFLCSSMIRLPISSTMLIMIMIIIIITFNHERRKSAVGEIPCINCHIMSQFTTQTTHIIIWRIPGISFVSW